MFSICIHFSNSALSFSTIGMSTSTKQRCKYWEKCYRKNQEHLDQYLHPSDINAQNHSKTGGSANSCARKDQVKSEKFSIKELHNSLSFHKISPLSHGAVSLSSSSPKVGDCVADKKKPCVGTSTKSVTVSSQGVGCSTSSSGKRNHISGIDFRFILIRIVLLLPNS